MAIKLDEKTSNSVVHNVDFPSRVKKNTPVGTTLLVILRIADIFWQYSLLRWLGPKAITALGGKAVPYVLRDAGVLSATTIFDLPIFYFGLVCLAAGTSIKQIVWVLFTSEQEMPIQAALMIATFNAVFNSVNSMLSLWSVSSGFTDSPLTSPIYMLGVTLFAIGVFFESYSEIQRKAFKSDPANKGKPFAGGLFALALNINYGGYTLWRAGFATAASGLLWGGFIGVFFFYDFYARAIPILDKYCLERYGNAFAEQRARAPYRLIPGIY